MRLIGTLGNEKQAFIFYSFLLEVGIHSTYERFTDPETKKEGVRVWIYEEDEIEKALLFLEEYKANPQDPRFVNVEFPPAPPLHPDLIAEQKLAELKKEKTPPKLWQIHRKPNLRKKRSYPLTYFIILLCSLLFFWNGAEQMQMLKADGKLSLQLGLTSLQQKLMFDYPLANQKMDQLLQKYPLGSVEDLKALPQEERVQFTKAQQIPAWHGITGRFLAWMKRAEAPPTQSPPLFEKIGKGEVWRLITPVLLHGGLLHILFNMAWAWILLRQIEERLPLGKILLLMLFIGIISNLAQYFVSGPYFLGFSGIVCGLVGFIWMRQKLAPWEGYPLQRSTIIFILIFVGAMFALELISFGIAALSTKDLSANIANTAHIVGGLVGILLGRIPFFSRGNK